MCPEPHANGAVDDGALELDQLVAEELAALDTPQGDPVEVELADLAARLRLHPDRGALLDRLRALVLDDAAPGPAPPAEPPPTDQV